MIALGRDLDEAMWRAVELETIAKQYHHALLLPGGPVILSDAAIAETLQAFHSYGVPGAKKIEKPRTGTRVKKAKPRSRAAKRA